MRNPVTRKSAEVATASDLLYCVSDDPVYHESRLAGRGDNRALRHDASGRAAGLFGDSKDLCFAGC
jgi:hypothetical protein